MLGLPAFLVGVPAEKAVGFYVAICLCQKHSTFKSTYKLAKPGFPLQPLTQIDFRILIFDFFIIVRTGRDLSLLFYQIKLKIWTTIINKTIAIG